MLAALVGKNQFIAGSRPANEPVALSRRPLGEDRIFINQRLKYRSLFMIGYSHQVVDLKLGARFRQRHIFNLDRKSTRLNSSHVATSYAVFCLKKKNVVAVSI